MPACGSGEDTCKEYAREYMRAMPAIASKGRLYRRRWAISAAIVVLVHAIVGGAVATWHIMIEQRQPPGPITLDLVPAPTGSQQAAVPSTAKELAPAPPKIEDKVEEKSATKGADKPEPKPIEEGTRAGSPIPFGRDGSSTEKSGAVERSASGGGNVTIYGSPIDTRAGGFGPRSSKAAKAKDGKVMIFGRPSRTFSERRQSRALDNTATNAIGAQVHDHTSPQRNLADLASPQPNALGLTEKNTAGASSMGAMAGPARNAIGVSITSPSNARPPGSIGQSSGAIAGASKPVTGASISGTGMVRPGSGAGAIGGPARNAAGVISGTGIRPRSP
jgi:hypothetical protein